MKTQKIVQSPIAKRMYDLKYQHAVDIMLGNVRNARNTYKEFAKLAVANFETALEVPAPIRGKISIFSKTGFNCLKYIIFNFFSKQSTEEKEFKKMIKEHKTKLELK